MCLLVLRQLLHHSVRLSRVIYTLNSQQKTFLVRENCLDFIVRQSRPVLRVYERVTATVQSHLTVHLRAHSIATFRCVNESKRRC